MKPSYRARSSQPSAVRTTSTTPRPQQGARSRPLPSISTATSAAVPEYEPLQYPLNPAGQHALARLQATHKLDDVQRRLKIANEVLSECAGDLNERFVERERRARAKAGRGGEGGKENEGGEGEEEEEDEETIRGTQSGEEMKEKVRGMTMRMEEHVRKVVDGQKLVIDIGEVLVEVRTVAAADVHIPSELRSTAQQRRRRQQRVGETDGNDEEMDESGNKDLEDSTTGSFEPTLDGDSRATQQPLRAPSQVFKERLQQKKDEYQSLTLTSRYSKHNDYIGFKRTVHDAIHGDDGPPLPHPSKWFDEERGSPAPGTQVPRNNAAAERDEESDDDIAIEREKISTKCPLTFTELEDPVTSTKCPHTFERSAITDLIQQSTSYTRGNAIRARHLNNEARVVQCPVAGCVATLTKEDLRVDQVLVRKIRRLQEAKRRREREEDDSDVVSDAPTSKKRAAPPVDLSDED